MTPNQSIDDSVSLLNVLLIPNQSIDLFSQLFGEEDPDQDVSPDTADPEASGDAGQASMNTEKPNDGLTSTMERTSTRTWAESTDYNAQKIFKKVSFERLGYFLKVHKRPQIYISLFEVWRA